MFGTVRIRCGVALVLAGLVTAVAQARPGVPQDTGGEDRPNPNVRFDQKLGDKVPLDLTLNDENGNEVRLGDCIGGKPTILILAYYRCPQLCGQVFIGVLEAIRPLKLTCGKDFNIVCVSFDPKEQPGLALAKKRYFVNEYGRKEADWGWKFLTGKQPSIEALTDAVGFHYEYDKTIKEYNHHRDARRGHLALLSRHRISRPRRRRPVAAGQNEDSSAFTRRGGRGADRVALGSRVPDLLSIQPAHGQVFHECDVDRAGRRRVDVVDHRWRVCPSKLEDSGRAINGDRHRDLRRMFAHHHVHFVYG
jgi:cytochrome oxidase Cu insertion factor (SCO1/SenC/PrrC family)